MGHPLRVNYKLRVLAIAAVLVSVLVPSEAISGPTVTVENVPLPVREALPVEPFFRDMQFLPTDGLKAVGVPGRRLAVTAIAITNFNYEDEELLLFNAIVSGSDCESGAIGGGAQPQVHVVVEARKTMQLTYPTPIVFEPHGGLACFGAGVTTADTLLVFVSVSGFTVAP